MCWGGRSQNVAKWCGQARGHCPRLLVEIMRAVVTQTGKEEKHKELAFSARTYEIIKNELLTETGVNSLTVTAKQ